MERITHIIILILLTALLIFSYEKSLPQLVFAISEANATFVNGTVTQDYTIAQYKLNQIEESASKIYWAHDYILGIYDCTQFSRDLVKELKIYNISSRCVFGVYIGDEEQNHKRNLHTWVEINDSDFDNVFYVEAMQGYIIDNDEFKEHYKIFSKGYCL